jgi:hypothetical protein
MVAGGEIAIHVGSKAVLTQLRKVIRDGLAKRRVDLCGFHIARKDTINSRKIEKHRISHRLLYGRGAGSVFGTRSGVDKMQGSEVGRERSRVVVLELEGETKLVVGGGVLSSRDRGGEESQGKGGLREILVSIRGGGDGTAHGFVRMCDET